MAPLARLLLRTESIASSKVEGKQADARDLARAEARLESGGKAGTTAAEILANIDPTFVGRVRSASLSIVVVTVFRKEEYMPRIVVDLDACEGHGLCYFEAPDLFDLRPSDGKAVVKVDPIPESLRPHAERCVEVCPERAIAVVDGA